MRISRLIAFGAVLLGGVGMAQGQTGAPVVRGDSSSNAPVSGAIPPSSDGSGNAGSGATPSNPTLPDGRRPPRESSPPAQRPPGEIAPPVGTVPPNAPVLRQ